MNKTALELIKNHEGFRKNRYTCTAGHLTIGYGYNLDANPLELSPLQIAGFEKFGIKESQANDLLEQMLTMTETLLAKRLPWTVKLSEARQAVLLDMAYNLGLDGLLKFQKTLMFIERRDYSQAADAMLNSKWATQVGNRAVVLAGIMRSGTVIKISTITAH